MQEVVQLLKDKAGLNDEQAVKAFEVVKEYIHSKVPPMFKGVVDNFLGTAAPAHADDDFLDKANEVTKETTKKIEGLAVEAKGEVEHFAKEAAERIDEWALKAEDAAKEAVEKLKGIIEENKHAGN